MAYGYLGQNTPNQTVNNSGVFSITDSSNLQSQGKLGGSLELIAEQTFTTSSTVENTSIQENKYDVHLLHIVANGSTSMNSGIQFYESGVLETASVYQWANLVGVGTGTFYESRTTGNAYLQFMTGANIGNSTNESGNAYCYFYNLTDSSKYSFMTHQCISMYDTNGMNMNFGSGVMPQASAVDGIQLILNGGNIDTADISLYGIRYS